MYVYVCMYVCACSILVGLIFVQPPYGEVEGLGAYRYSLASVLTKNCFLQGFTEVTTAHYPWNFLPRVVSLRLKL